MLKYIPMSGGRDGYSLFVTYAINADETLAFRGYVIHAPSSEEYGPYMQFSEATQRMNGLRTTNMSISGIKKVSPAVHVG